MNLILHSVASACSERVSKMRASVTSPVSQRRIDRLTAQIRSLENLQNKQCYYAGSPENLRFMAAYARVESKLENMSKKVSEYKLRSVLPGRKPGQFSKAKEKQESVESLFKELKSFRSDKNTSGSAIQQNVQDPSRQGTEDSKVSSGDLDGQLLKITEKQERVLQKLKSFPSPTSTSDSVTQQNVQDPSRQVAKNSDVLPELQEDQPGQDPAGEEQPHKVTESSTDPIPPSGSGDNTGSAVVSAPLVQAAADVHAGDAASQQSILGGEQGGVIGGVDEPDAGTTAPTDKITDQDQLSLTGSSGTVTSAPLDTPQVQEEETATHVGGPAIMEEASAFENASVSGAASQPLAGQQESAVLQMDPIISEDSGRGTDAVGGDETEVETAENSLEAQASVSSDSGSLQQPQPDNSDKLQDEIMRADQTSLEKAPSSSQLDLSRWLSKDSAAIENQESLKKTSSTSTSDLSGWLSKQADKTEKTDKKGLKSTLKKVRSFTKKAVRGALSQSDKQGGLPGNEAPRPRF